MHCPDPTTVCDVQKPKRSHCDLPSQVRKREAQRTAQRLLHCEPRQGGWRSFSAQATTLLQLWLNQCAFGQYQAQQGGQEGPWVIPLGTTKRFPSERANTAQLSRPGSGQIRRGRAGSSGR